MAYQITYGPVKRKESRPGKVKGKLLAGLVIGAILIGLRVSGMGEAAARWVFPGDAEATENALHTMTQSIEAGESVADAFSCFCQEIIENANLPE